MKRLVLIGAFLIGLCGPVLAQVYPQAATPQTTFFFDSVSGSDSNNCLTTGTACQTVSKMQSVQTANSTIAIKAGSTFTSTYTVQQAGVKHIVYGSGANPVFDASTPIATSWTQGPGQAAQESCTGTCVFASGMETASFSDWTTVNATDIPVTRVSASPCPAHGTWCEQVGPGVATGNRGYLTKTFTAVINTTYYFRFYFYEPSGAFKASQSGIKIADAMGGTVLVQAATDASGNVSTLTLFDTAHSASLATGAATGFLPNTWNYIEFEVLLSATVGGGQLWFNGTSIGSNFTVNNSSFAGAQNVNIGLTGFASSINIGAFVYYDDFQMNTVGPIGAFSAGLPTTVWSTPLASNPLMPVFPTGTQATNVANAAAVLAPGNWSWVGSSTLYVYSLTNPGTTIGLPTRTSAIVINGKQNVALGNLTVRGAIGGSGLGGVALSGNFSGLNVNNSLFESNYQIGLGALENTATIQNTSITNNVFRYNGASGSMYNISFQLNNYFAYNRAYGNGAILTKATSDLSFTSGIHFFSQNANNNGNSAANAGQGTIIEYNWSYNNGPNSTSNTLGNGIHLDTVNGMIVRNNNVYGNYGRGILIEKNGSTIVYDNNAWNNAVATFTGNIGVICSGGQNASNNQIFNNTMYGGYWGLEAAPYQGLGASTFNSNLFTNNISINTVSGQNLYVATPGGDNLGGEGTGNTYTYDNMGVAASVFIQYGATGVSTYAAFDTAYGSTTHSVQGDPLFISPTTSPPNFGLKSGSPAIGASTAIAGFITAGTNLGSQYPASQ